MKILQISNSNYDSPDEQGQRFSPLHFGYHELKELGYDVRLLLPEAIKGTWRIMERILGRHVEDIILQYKCINESKSVDLIYYPIDRHCIALALFRKLKLIQCPVVMLCHFSLNTKYVSSFKSKIYKTIERNLVFRYIDKVLFPCEQLRNIAQEAFPEERHFGVVHWGADPEWYGKYRIQSSTCKYYMACGGTNRDYKTLIDAVRDLQISVKIFTSTEQVRRLKRENPSSNIELIEAVGPNRKEMLRKGYGEAKAVLIPIKQKNDVPNGATVLVEALAAGKAVVISDLATNFVDVENEKIGLKVEMHNAKDWKRKIQILEENPSLLNQYGENARKLAINQFNLHRLAEELSKYFCETKNEIGR